MCQENRFLFMGEQWIMLGTLLAQNNKQGYEEAICYHIRTLRGADYRYNPVEK